MVPPDLFGCNSKGMEIMKKLAKKILGYIAVILGGILAVYLAIKYLIVKNPNSIESILPKIRELPKLPEVDVAKESAVVEAKVAEQHVEIANQVVQDIKAVEQETTQESIDRLSPEAIQKIEDIKKNTAQSITDAIINDLK